MRSYGYNGPSGEQLLMCDPARPSGGGSDEAGVALSAAQPAVSRSCALKEVGNPTMLGI
jgi:hypothetical protein